MTINRADILSILKTSHLFRALDDTQLEQVLTMCELITLNAGQPVYIEGMAARYFFVVLQGKVEVSEVSDGEIYELSTLVSGDYFGEEALMEKRIHGERAFTLEETTLLRLSAKNFDKLLTLFPRLKPGLKLAVSTFNQVRMANLTWLNPEEVVYLMTRRHRYFLLTRQIAPALIGLVALVAIFAFPVALIPNSSIPVLCSGGVLLLALVWAAWNRIDWGNDEALITNQRLVLLERVAGIYDSRDEAPIAGILSVNINTTQLGRLIGYADVIVRTYTGTLVLHRIPHAAQVAAILEEQWFRAKHRLEKTEAEAMRQAIRRRLGLSPSQPLPMPSLIQTAPAEPSVPEVKPGLFQDLFASLFRMRHEADGVLTYRKHWFILLKKTWKPVLGMTAFFALCVFRAINLFTFLPLNVVLIGGLIAMVGFSGWALYQYEDWRNDIYQVTPDQIVDLERRPLGREEKKSAPLENILGIQYERLGLLGVLLNFGTVKIMVGSSEFTFDYVYNPSEVQQDVFRRVNQRANRKRQEEAEAERERVSEWIAAYHEDFTAATKLPRDRSDFPPPPSF